MVTVRISSLLDFLFTRVKVAILKLQVASPKPNGYRGDGQIGISGNDKTGHYRW